MANPHDDFSVTVEKVDAVYLVKLSSDYLELNLRFDQAKLGLFTNIESADWNRRGSIALGSCLGAPVFWSASENGRVSMVIGADDEVWDVGLEISMTTLHRIRQELAQASSA
ncbi:MAG: hypothetical protein ACI9KE_000956 [Polyangiales bacterium]|jgi:hypothetical protein